MTTEAVRWLDEHRIHTVRVEGVNLDGLLIGKYLSRHKFESALASGAFVCDIAFAFDLGGMPHLGWWGAWRPPFMGDIVQRPDPSTLVEVPGQPGVAACLVDYTNVDGVELSICPRSIARRLTRQLAELGYEARMATEIEAYLFDEPLPEARSKGFRDLTPRSGFGPQACYSIPLAYELEPFLGEARRRLDVLGVPWEATNAEVGLGQFELNIAPSDPVTAADWWVRAKQVLREVALDQGRTVTFLSKPPLPPMMEGIGPIGSGAHLHHSLWQDGRSAFYDESGPGNRSRVMHQWMGGLLATMPGTVSLVAPTITSYRRYAPFLASYTLTWGEENKSTGLRTVSRSPSLARIEHRLAASEVNPYLLVAAVLAGGLAGLELQIEPPDEFDAFALGAPTSAAPEAPSDILAAAAALEDDKRLTQYLGVELVDYWVSSRRWEWMMFHTTGGDPEAKEVTDWELRRYFEQV